MGEERWRRGFRSLSGVGVPACLAPFFLLVSLGSLPVPMRAMAGALCVVSLAAAVDAWGAGLVVGSDGIVVRRTFLRHRLAWADVDRFDAKRSGLSRLSLRVVLRDGSQRPISDHALPAEEGQKLLEDLYEELEAHRR